MKYTFLGAVIVLFVSLFASSVLALEVTSSGIISASGSTSIAPALNLGKLEVIDTQHLTLKFSSPVEIGTLKLKIMKQGDNSTLKITSLTGSKGDDTTVVVTLETELQQGSAYTLTAVSAIGKDGSLIKDGALALKDFVTPIPLKSPEIIMSAAPNPNAILVKTGASTPSVMVTPQKTPVAQPSIKPQIIPPTKELPLTGMNPFYLLIIILPIALFFMRRKV